MTKAPGRTLVPSLLLVALLALAHVEHGLALIGTVWRLAVLSWDNPATQVIEEVASQAVPHVDPARSLRDRIAAAPADVAGAPPPDAGARSLAPALTACDTRAPPLA
ncbi:MAG: hypothetical protein ACREM3_16670 [Candidatus Rokuibacteriota bacterium]